MWVKICGNTNLEDCLRAADLGADAVGFVFALGKRTVTVGQVASITSHLPETVEKIGVFTTTDFAEIVNTVERAGLTGVQLHGPLDLGLLTRLRVHLGHQTSRCSLIQVLPWWTDIAATEQQDALAKDAKRVSQAGSADALLIDSRTREASGGTGATLDWAAATNALREVNCRVVLAGGLRPQNVQDAIAVFRPWGVDVASGVESSPGRKDVRAVAQFILNARSASR